MLTIIFKTVIALSEKSPLTTTPYCEMTNKKSFEIGSKNKNRHALRF